MITIGRLAKKFGLSRSTLLYYDSIGLLKPSARSDNEYRYYSEEDERRLEQVCTYRQAGIPLKQIRQILDSEESSITQALEQRLSALNDEITTLRNQQRFILGILQSDESLKKIKVMNKKTWTDLLAASGFSDEEMWQWHRQFESRSPDKHQEFLEFLCIPDREIRQIRLKSRINGE